MRSGGTPGEGRGPIPSRVPSFVSIVVPSVINIDLRCRSWVFDVFEHEYELHNGMMRSGGAPGEGRGPIPSRVPSTVICVVLFYPFCCWYPVYVRKIVISFH